MFEAWEGFKLGHWSKEVDVRDFIQKNYRLYEGDDSFLAAASENTKSLWQDFMELTRQEIASGGVLDMDDTIVASINSHSPAYLDKEKETIVGFQTDKPFKRALLLYGGLRTSMQALEKNGYKLNAQVENFFKKHRKTHNDGVFDIYTDEMRLCRSNHIITGLPDAYGRGRIIGDYRRIALYGIDFLIEDKKKQKELTGTVMTSDVMRDREEISEQIRALKDLVKMAESYGFDITKPAKNVQEAIQFTYFGYLGALNLSRLKSQDSWEQSLFNSYNCNYQ